MNPSRLLVFAAVIIIGLLSNSSGAPAETVGKAVSIRTVVTGDRGELKRADPISRKERIRANKFGLGQFEFVDGTKLAVGPNSTVVIDEYVLGSDNRFKKFALNATRGTFRWISGKSNPAAYQINTPAGSSGVRGTAVDVTVSGDAAMMVLLKGSARWCNRDGNRRECVTVNRPCDFIIARRGQGVTDPAQVSRTALNAAGADAAFLRNNKRLLASFQLGRSNCGMGQRVVDRPTTRREGEARATPAPRRDSEPDPDPPGEGEEGGDNGPGPGPGPDLR